MSPGPVSYTHLDVYKRQVIQYGNLTDVQKTLLQDTLISHADDSDLLAEDDFWDIISEAAENVDARVQKEMKAQSEASIKAVTDIALEVNNAVNGDFTGNNPVMLVWDCMMWTMNFMPEVEPVSYTHLDVYKRQGLTVTTFYLAKGLEFDQVFAIQGSEENPLKKQAEYICATRALHELYVYGTRNQAGR